VNSEHPTFNIQHPTPKALNGRAAFPVWCALLAVVCFGSLFPAATFAQTALSNLVFAVGTTWQDYASHQWSYVLLDSSDGLVLAGRRFAVFGKTGTASSTNSFTQRGTMFRQTDATAIAAILNQTVALGDDLNSLSDGLNLMFRNVPGITNQPLAQKVLSAFQVAATNEESDQLLSLMGKGHPGLNRCLGLAFAEQVTNVTTYEVRELDSAGTPGDVIGRVTVIPGAPVILPAPGRPFQVVTNNPSDHLRVRLRWGAPLELRRLAPLQFGYNVWRIARTDAEAAHFDVNPPSTAQLTTDSHFVRANLAAVMPSAELDLGGGLGGAENLADRLTYFFSDTGRMTGGAFTDGQGFYYFVTARDILGRDGLVSFGGLAHACRRLPPAPPTDVRVDNTVLPGSTNAPRLLVSWQQNTNPTNAVTHYWIYRWTNPSMVLVNDADPTNGIVGIVPQLPGTNRNFFLDTSAGALTNANLTNVWYTIRAVSVAACDPLLSPHSPPAWGVLRQRDAPLATTGEVLGSCGTPVVMFQNFATNAIPADPQTWNFRLTCVRRDPGIAWVQFTITNTLAGVSTQLTTIGPVYFPPSGDTAQLDYPLPAGDLLIHTLQVGCIVGTAYDQVSAAANCTMLAPVPAAEQHEAIFYAGELLATALSADDPLLAVLNNGNTACYPGNNVTVDASGMVAMTFNTGPVPLLVQAFTGNAWHQLGIVTPDANQIYWVSYPACLIGPLPPFRGCIVNLPSDGGCDQHVARAATDGPVAPLRVRFRLTLRTREYRVYRRAGDGPLTLFAQGAALYDPANTNKLIEAKDDAMPVSPTRLCYYVQLLDNQGHGSPLALVGCKAVGALPRPIMAEPQPLGTVGNPQVMLNWFCPTSGVARFEIKISRVDPPSPSAASGFASLIATPYSAHNPAASYLGLTKQKTSLSIFREAQMTTPIGPSFGPGPQFTLTATVLANVAFDISVSAVDAQGIIGPPSEISRFTWTPPVVLPTVPWPKRPLPPVRDFDAGTTPPIIFPRVAAIVFYDSDGVAPNPRYPVGVRIGELGIPGQSGVSGQPNDNALTEHANEYLQYSTGTGRLFLIQPDPNAGVFRSLSTAYPGQLLLPIVVYREQLTNSLFPRVSGDVVQVTPLIERIPWMMDTNRIVTIPDRLFAGFTEYHAPLYHYYFYLRDLQPVQLGAAYRYFVVHFNDQREIQEIIPAGDVELPLN
jgi:hypothetical protein